VEVSLRCRLALARTGADALGALTVLTLLAGGCGEWPRYKHLPATEETHPSTTDPRTLIALTWVSMDESEGNDSPVIAQQTSLPLGTAFAIAGALEGTGWYDLAEQTVISDPECGSATGTRTPLSEGDYIGDVDFYVFEVAEPGLLCARAVLGASTFGWDLLVFPVDACDVPGPAVVDGSSAVGLDLGGPSGGWGLAVAPGRYALLLAAYSPNDADATLAYDLGVALVPDGDGPLCPLLPVETPNGATP
jgi:hypothetical protein